MYKQQSVVAIPSSYNISENIEVNSTKTYLRYLQNKGATAVMTTAGTSQFNLLANKEIHKLNECLVNYFQDGQTILGMPALSTSEACKFAKVAKKYMGANSYLMTLYPDRFYDQAAIINYVRAIAESIDSPIYLHAQKLRSGTGGDWDYNADTINQLYGDGVLVGIKEEHSNLMESYNFVSNLHENIDVIVAGGSMRRFSFLKSAGANAFVAGIGNLFPQIENDYILNNSQKSLQLETQFFDVSMKYGWHYALRAGLQYLELTCFYNREPWPAMNTKASKEIINIIDKISKVIKGKKNDK